jgi:hypothetical protein
MLNSVTSYKAVFGQDYTQATKCSITELRQCRTIWDRLKVSPDDRIAKFVREELIAEEDDDALDYFSATKNHDGESVLQDRKQPPELLVQELVDELRPPSGVNTTAPLLCLPVQSGQNSPLQSATDHVSFLYEASDSSSNAEVVERDLDVSPKPTTRSLFRVDYALDEAWEAGHVAKSHRKLGRRGQVDFKFVFPTLKCECCFPIPEMTIPVGDTDYVKANASTQRWYDGDFISSFAMLVSHCSHINKRQGTLDLPQLLHVTYPKEKLFPSHCKKLQSTVSRVVAIMHNNDHYAVMEVDIKYMFIKIYDGLNRPLLDYLDHVLHALKKCMLADREDTIIEVTINVFDYVGVLGHSRQATKQVSSYSLDINSRKWRLDRGHFIQQTDGFNCRPIACLKIMELYHQISIDDVQLAYSTNSIRRMVIDKWIDMVTTCNDVLRVSVAEKLGGGSMTICFCCVDSPSMDIIRTPCCKNNVHRHCILRNMTINSQCVYCRKVLKYQVITDCPAEPRTTTTSPGARKRTMVDDTIHKEEATPLRVADRVRQHSQEKRRLRQIAQGNKMIRTQAQSIAKLGASPGAVVTVKVDHRAVSHAYGVVGVIMELTRGGAAKVATEAGILCHGIRKTIWWIPSDQYSLQYRANEQANIPDKLQKIRDAIINGTDHDTLLTHTTIQVAHQKAVGVSSPCVRGKCGCKDGKCGGRCGCIKAGKVCTSACSCNGNCKNNPKN